MQVKKDSGSYRDFPKKDKDELTISPAWRQALFFASQGFKVFPLKKWSKEPLIRGWQEKATNDLNTILEWAQSYPNSNYGVITGQGFFVIDFDLEESCQRG